MGNNHANVENTNEKGKKTLFFSEMLKIPMKNERNKNGCSVNRGTDLFRKSNKTFYLVVSQTIS